MENKIKKEFIGRIVVKEIVKGKQKFNAYSCVTEKGNWFDVSFYNDVVKPTKNCVIRVSGDNWFTQYKKNEKGEYILNKEGQKIKRLVIKGIDDILNYEEIPSSLKSEELDYEI